MTTVFSSAGSSGCSFGFLTDEEALEPPNFSSSMISSLPSMGSKFSDCVRYDLDAPSL